MTLRRVRRGICLGQYRAASTLPPPAHAKAPADHTNPQHGASGVVAGATTYQVLRVGGNLLSHSLPGAVPSARAGLASGFGKGPGVSPPPSTTDTPTGACTTLTNAANICTSHCQPTHHHKRWVVCCVSDCTVDARTFHRVSYAVLPTNKPMLCVGVYRPISTSHLHALLRFQIRPINPVVSWEPQTKPHLKTGFPLRCFQRLSLPYVANQPCPWRNNWHTRGTSVPVLSY